MFLIYCGLAALLSCCGLRYVDCQPSFTVKPNNGNPIYVTDGAGSLTLAWDYNADGRTVERVHLVYINGGHDIVVARKAPGQPLQINELSGYNGRVTFTGRATFRISSIVPSDSRIYKCRVTFETASPPEISDSSVEVVVVVRPVITLKSPTFVELDEGSSTTLLCFATGNPKPTYTWKKGSAIVQEKADSNYTIASANKDHTGSYTCTATVSAPGVGQFSDVYSLDVKVKYKPQVIRLYPNQTLDDGRDAVFYCEAVAFPTAITYNWFKDGSAITSDPNGDVFVDSVGSQSRLRVEQIKKNSAGRYSCSGKNSIGTGEQKAVFLKVKYAPQNVTVTPERAEVKEGQSTTLTCHSDGYPAPGFSWKFKGIVLNGATQNTLVLTNVEVKDAGNYTCVAKNPRGSKETTKVVNVLYKPTITTLTTGTPNNNVVQGTPVTISCSANGYPVPSYTIKRNDTDVTQNAGVGKHRINNIRLSAEYDSYSCVPHNSEGNGPREVLKITVQVPPRFSGTTLPANRQVKEENTSVSYSCVAEAKPAAKIQWVLNGKNLTNSPPYNISGSFQTIQGSKLFKTFSYLDIAKLTWRQYGNFSCVAYNEAGQVRQNTELEVRYRPVVQFPADHPKNLTLGEGATATFSCKTIGNPPTTVQKWQFNGVDIPGESCSGCTTTTLQKGAVSQLDAGWYSCIGTNSLGDGPPASAQLLIKHAPKITYFPKGSYTVNETNSVSMVCRAGGVPRPTITWVKGLSGDEKIVGVGEQFTIANTSGSDDGKYTCRAKNELGSDSREVTLNVQTRPTITTSSPMATNVPGAKDEKVVLTCIVSAKPPALLSWKRNLDGNELSTINDGKVESILKQSGSIEMRVVVTTINEEFYCVAVNLLGSNSQKYRIRERGAPDAPEDVRLVPFQVPGAKTVSVNVSWTPGYNGGFRQGFSILYRKKESGGDFTEESVGNPPNSMHTVQNLSPKTDYEFKLHATNERGKGAASPLAQVMTKDSAVAPDRGTVTATRSSDDATVIIVTWTILDKAVTQLSIEMQEGESTKVKRAVGGWQPVPGTSDLDISQTEFKVENLKADKVYRFRVGMIRDGENLSTCGEACYVESEPVRPGPIPGARGDDGALQDWMIAVIAGVAGLLLLGIVILCLCCFMRRKKTLGDNQVNMSQTSSYVVGGPEVNRSLDTRPRSYGMESVEDDPFIEAHFASMQSMNTAEGKKKKPDNGVNYGYLSQDSVQNQPEMLLNPGSRLPRNHPVAQSTGDLDANSGYPARGPQRDFSTLPPYHEPPSFEEAMRQSGRKPKTRKSTGDLTGGQARHSGRKPRQSPADEPTDSSDGEFRYTPQRAAPPPPRVRHVESSREDPRYVAVDKGHGLGPRVLPQGPPVTSAPRNNGPLDPTVPYAIPQKKKSRKPRSEPSEPAFDRIRPPPMMYGAPYWRESYKGWPPPQYTAEDRSPGEPVQLPGDLDLDDPSTLPASERPPELPPPMPMFSSSRSMPIYYDDPDDGLPEPPAFLRDVVRPPDGREPRYVSDRAAPYHPPPSPGRQRQPYVNIHGQLVRPSSRDSDDFRRPESLRSSRDALTPEPETPSHQWKPRGNEPDNRGAPEINYVSYLV